MRRLTFSTLLAPLTALVTLAPLGAHATPPVEMIAPESTIASLWCADVKALCSAWHELPMIKMLDDERLRTAFAPLRESWESQVKDLGSGDADKAKDVGVPGAVGAALFTEEDAELDATRVAYFVYADFGENSEKCWDLASEWIRTQGQAQQWSISEEMIGGEPAIVAAMPPTPADEMDEGLSMFGQLVVPPEELVITRSGGVVIAASSAGVAEDVVEALRAPAAAGHLASTKAWKDVAPVVEGAAVSGGLYFGAVGSLLEPIMVGPMEGAADVQKALFGNVSALAIAGSVGVGDRQLALRASVIHEDGPKGLFTLLNDGAPIEAPSKALGDACLSYQSWRISISSFPDFLDGMLNAMPEELSGQVEGMVAMYMPALKKACSTLGPRIESVAREDESAPEGMTGVTRIACSDEKAIVPFIQLMAPMLTPTDFQGAQVFADPAVPDLAIGLAPTAMYIGERTAVESGLRANAASDGDTIAQTALWKRASAFVGSQAVIGFACSDLVASLEASREQFRAAQALLDSVNEGAPVDGAEMLDAMTKSLDAVDFSIVREYLGPQVTFVTAGKSAHTLEWVILTP